MATLYTPTEIAAIARAGALCAAILTEAAEAARGSAAGPAIDALVRRRLAEAGADAVLAELSGPAGAFPGAISISTGAVIANGQPGGSGAGYPHRPGGRNCQRSRPPRPPGHQDGGGTRDGRVHAPPPGAIVRLDLALRLDGWIADAATSVVVEPAAGPGADAAHRLIAAARAITDAAIGAIRPGACWAEVLAAGHAAAAAAGVTIADWPWGHGVGRRLHESPALPSDPADPAADFTLRRGMVLAIEPIVLSHAARLQTAADGWTLTACGGDIPLAACEERTVAVGHGGGGGSGGSRGAGGSPEILTPVFGAGCLPG